jgi:hypothetical protein
MIITQLKRWHWLAISVVVGLCLWAVRRGQVADVSLYGEGLNSQATFEQALLSDVQGIPAFKSIRIYRTVADDGSGRPTPIDVVAGKYCNGTPAPDGKYHWNPFVFVARLPYRPTIDLSSEFSRPGMPDAASRWQKIPEPSVADFLRLAHDYRSVQFSRAWWNEHLFLTWFGGSVLLIGLIWPCVIDLIVHGRLIRPPTEKGIDLGKVKLPAPQHAEGPSVQDLDRLRELEEELEHGLADAVPVVVASASAESPIRELQATAQTTLIADEHEHKNYRRKADDFYPTEDRAHKPTDSAPGGEQRAG